MEHGLFTAGIVLLIGTMTVDYYEGVHWAVEIIAIVVGGLCMGISIPHLGEQTVDSVKNSDRGE